MEKDQFLNDATIQKSLQKSLQKSWMSGRVQVPQGLDHSSDRDILREIAEDHTPRARAKTL
jgi:hypothetical protein